jgi:ABC-2 type transport system ATP-binding protein
MIEVRNLTKAFGVKLAVNDVSFNVQRGEVLGFLGPNGAGKSTTMRMLTGFIPPTEGDVVIGGFRIEENPIAVKRLVGYLPENAPSYSDMTVRGFLNFAAELRGFRGAEKARAVERVVEMCFLGSVLHQSIETLSKGFRHRTCFAQSIIHDPAVLIRRAHRWPDPNQKHSANLIRRWQKRRSFFRPILDRSKRSVRAQSSSTGRIVANGTPAEQSKISACWAVTVRIANSASAVKMKLSELSSGERLTTP